MKQDGVLTDPFGLQVIIAESLCDVSQNDETAALYNDYRSVIERPAFVIEIEGAKACRYYCRSIGWGTTLLVRADQRNDAWEANYCSKNPSDTYLKNLAAQGQIYSTDPWQL